jgi:Leucine carboxyl methyltransferase
VLGRARYNEDKLSDAISKGISQYVIIGAGLDTFALRRPDLQNRLRVLRNRSPLNARAEARPDGAGRTVAKDRRAQRASVVAQIRTLDAEDQAKGPRCYTALAGLWAK